MAETCTNTLFWTPGVDDWTIEWHGSKFQLFSFPYGCVVIEERSLYSRLLTRPAS
jgi:hypothetical protein